MRGPVARMVRAGASRHRLSTVVVALVVAASTAMVVLGIGLLTAANAPFDSSFARQHGAHAVATFDATKVTVDQLTAAASRAGATTAGPYAVAIVAMRDRALGAPALSVAGRDRPDPAVDVLALDSGRWANAPGEIVLSRDRASRIAVGDRLTIGPDSPTTLTVVGIASSITDTADAWVVPAQVAAFGVPSSLQMLYRFASADDDRAVSAGVASATQGLPADALVGATSYLAIRLDRNGTAAVATPFVVAFAVLGMVISLLIVANVVSGAVVAGHRTTGILKALGFTPRQVVLVHAGRMLGPAAVAGGIGLGLGNLLALPVLNETAEAYDVSVVTVPWWANLVAIVGLVLVVGAAAVVPALRAGRMPATAAIALGRGPRANRGHRARRLLARLPLSRPIGLGLGTPFVRPARAMGTIVAIMLGATTMVFAVGLAISLDRVSEGLTRSSAAPVRVVGGGGPERGGGGPGLGGGPPTMPSNVEGILLETPGTAHVAGERSTDATVVGVTGEVRVTGYTGDSSWLGYPVIAGRWFTGPDEAVVPTHLLAAAGRSVGDTITVTLGDQQRVLRIVGEIFDLENQGMDVVTDAAVVAALRPEAGVQSYVVGLTAGTNVDDYLATLDERFPPNTVSAFAEDSTDETIVLFLGLIVTLMLLVGAVAALGVFNTTLLNTREQVREIGILKAIGMTPRQVTMMVLSSLAGLGVVFGALATPLGTALHRMVLEAMAHAAATNVPESFLAVFGSGRLVGLAATGLVIAVVGALIPATWAARATAAVALRAE